MRGRARPARRLGGRRARVRPPRLRAAPAVAGRRHRGRGRAAARADVVTTLTEAGLGLLLGAVVGLLLAVLIAAFPWVSDTVYPLVTLTQTVPTVVLAPLLILWAGFGLLPKVVLVALTAFFPVLVAAAATYGSFTSLKRHAQSKLQRTWRA